MALKGHFLSYYRRNYNLIPLSFLRVINASNKCSLAASSLEFEQELNLTKVKKKKKEKMVKEEVCKQMLKITVSSSFFLFMIYQNSGVKSLATTRLVTLPRTASAHAVHWYIKK